MKKIHYCLLFTLLLFMSACNKKIDDMPEEDYWRIFQIDSAAIDTPDRDEGYENMFKSPCDPETDENGFVYPGITPKGEIRNYTVTIDIYIREVDAYNDNAPMYSDFMIRYVNEEKKLVTLKSKEVFGKLDYKNGASKQIRYNAKSGYPIYLAIVGGGSNRFTLRASIQAESEDKLIITPKLEFNFYKSFDGLGTIDPSYCEKIILP
ncbi:hypothetical protein [Porphyromonas pogonae]|uniref:hypothetical protein n=1 Tax=Porphyromonas pogonae TaxID=867595 RepID=UPI002E772A8B|nr:hypothetical protein [Porphyromonas pogonae]